MANLAVLLEARLDPPDLDGARHCYRCTKITYTPTPSEAALVVKYYNCPLETGVRDEFDALILESKKEVVAEHAAELEKSPGSPNSQPLPANSSPVSPWCRCPTERRAPASVVAPARQDPNR